MIAGVPKGIAGVTISLATYFCAGLAWGDVVYFGDTTLPPSSTLQVGGITVTHPLTYGATGVPATVAGVGLGSAALGPVDSVDRIEHYSAGNLRPDSVQSEGLSLAVDGGIDSITILPYFSILGSDQTTFLEFDVSYFPYGTGSGETLRYQNPSNPNSITINFQPGFLPSSVDLGLVSDQGDYYYFYNYLTAQGLPDVTFEFGYTIESLVYTPVPEAGTDSFLTLGSTLCAGVSLAGRFRSNLRARTV